jgi:hypothetical protein
MRGVDVGWRGWSLALAAIVLAAGPAAAARGAREHMPLPGKVYAWTFQADTLGQKPTHSMSFGGSWQVVEDSTSLAPVAAAADSDSMATPPPVPARRLLSQSEADDGVVYHYLNFTRPTLADLDASVRFRIRSGDIDPSAGLLFQMDPKGKSGYCVRAMTRNSEIAFHYLLNGKRRDVKFAKIPELVPGVWHTIAVTKRRSLIKISYDGQSVMEVRDDRYTKGTVGVWTEDDTLVDFADLTATAR